MPHDTTPAPPCLPTPQVDALLAHFYEAAAVEHRLLDLEYWLLNNRPAQYTWQWFLRWDRCVLRLRKLIRHNPALAPLAADVRLYLRTVYVGGGDD